MSDVFDFDSYIMAYYEKHPPLMHFAGESRDEWYTWQQRLRARLLELMEPFPEQVPLDAHVVEEREQFGVHYEKVVYTTEENVQVPAWLLISNDLAQPAPGIICLHGHGLDGKDNVAHVDYGEEERARTIERANYDYGLQLAKRGYVTLCPDARGFGERREGFRRFVKRDGCNVNGIMTFLFGMNLMALNTWDDMRGLDYLASRPEVDADRLGCIGLSFGGTRSMYLAAVDERVKAADVVCYLTTFKQYALTQGNFCGSQFVPGILKYAEVADVCGLVAPRPLLIESGIHDGGFPIEAAREAYAHLETIYAAAQVSESLWLDEFDGGHQFSGAKAFDFFNAYL